MTIWNMGSINADYVYGVPHLPAPGETVAAATRMQTLGGKGANQSVAAARAGATVNHLGAVGPEGAWLLQRLSGYGVNVDRVAQMQDTASGHALIFVAPDGENSIVIHGGANRALTEARAIGWMEELAPGDTLMLQNETDAVTTAAAAARERGARVVYSAAPFDAEAARAMLPLTDLLILNAVEVAQLATATGSGAESLPVPEILVTLGAEGARYRCETETGGWVNVPAPRVTPVDTTGAGDTFAGWFCALRDLGQSPAQALQGAAQAAAIQVTRPGTAEAIPTAEEVRAALRTRGISDDILS